MSVYQICWLSPLYVYICRSVLIGIRNVSGRPHDVGLQIFTVCRYLEFATSIKTVIKKTVIKKII